ncbi:hypothetical protein JKP88DRAFT_280511 [Tribonema minus]|uniref:Uncharacterized protein n=1 Tax=Tribonema minus TaxID=303371 RepID=A0A835YPJ6_9STRA|nr:hypothetical protein JKP88DRAFT_280511 [Tribonema minus]
MTENHRNDTYYPGVRPSGSHDFNSMMGYTGQRVIIFDDVSPGQMDYTARRLPAARVSNAGMEDVIVKSAILYWRNELQALQVALQVCTCALELFVVSPDLQDVLDHDSRRHLAQICSGQFQRHIDDVNNRADDGVTAAGACRLKLMTDANVRRMTVLERLLQTEECKSVLVNVLDVPAEVDSAPFAALKHLSGKLAQVVVIENSGGVAAAQEIFDTNENILWLGISGSSFVIEFNRQQRFAPFARRYNTAKNIGRPQLLLLHESTTWETEFTREIEVVEPPYRDRLFSYFEHGRWTQVDVLEWTVGITLMNMAGHSKDRTHDFDKKTAATNLRAAFKRCHTSACNCGRPEWTVGITLMNMAGHSKDRTHDFDKKTAATNLRAAFKRCHTSACNCGRPECDAVMVLRGVHAASPDRADNTFGYCHPGQVNSTSKRMNRLIKNIKDEHRTEAERSQVVQYNGTIRKQQLDKGDAQGMMHFTNVPNQASPDRIDNSNPFYDLDNVRLVCQSCNYSENDYSRVHVERPSANNPAEYALDISKVIVYLTSVIAAEERKENDTRKRAQAKKASKATQDTQDTM